ncbi:hypothetical protein C8R46DRAFT_899598 [Mycena filopes]|nr:hypothetical protein C8R46DRAFT_899598 [Mycena filopes]
MGADPPELNIPGLSLLHSAIAIGASYDSIERYPPPRCHPHTREVVFDIILAWLSNTLHGPRVLWVHGDPGTGKSAISQTVAEYCAQSNQLGATFFFSRGQGDLSDGRLLFPTIAYKLASARPELRVPMSRAIQAAPALLHSQSLEMQVKKLIVEPFGVVPHPPSPILIIIDALDACEGTQMQHRILTLLAQLLIVHRLPLCFLVTSRTSPSLQATFDAPVFRKLTTRIGLDSFASTADVRSFLRAEFSRIQSQFNPPHDPWPPEDVLELVAQKSGGQFLYPATVLKYVDDRGAGGDPDQRLRDVVLSAVSAVPSAFTPTDQLYHHILGSAPDSAALLRILGALVVLYAPLPERQLESVLGLGGGEVRDGLRGMAALVDVPDPAVSSPSQPVRIPQPSTTEFLLDIRRSLMFWIDPRRYHGTLVCGCIRYLLEMESAESVNLYVVNSIQTRCAAFGDSR